MDKIAFVILHYETVNDTEECLNSLKKDINKENVYIVVVDNGSKVGMLKSLEDKYKESKQIHFLYSKENLGFAGGNNIGFKYAKDVLHANLIVLANNDLIFNQDGFINILLEKYKSDMFDIAGPRIISLVDHKNQNPVPVLYKDISSLRKRILKYRLLDFFSIFNFDLIIQQKFAKEIEEYFPGENDDYQLHGACLIFGERYISNYNGLYDKTFMYGEESILKYIVIRDGLIMKYIDEIEVIHKEGSSTQKMLGNGKKKRRFYYKWNIKSCLLLKNMMKEVN